MKYTFEFLENEIWWGGASVRGTQYPLTKESVLYENFNVKVLNQAMPFYLSNKGRYIWSENPFEVTIENGVFSFEGKDIEMHEADGVRFLLLSLEQYLLVYQKSSKDGYRVNVRQKKDADKIKFIESKL